MNIFQEAMKERKRQDDKWKEQNHEPKKWMVILMEEVGEASQAILEGRNMEYRDELVQVIAVAVAALESLERGNLIKEDNHD